MQPLARGTDDPQLFVVNCKADIKDAKKFIRETHKEFIEVVKKVSGICNHWFFKPSWIKFH